MRLDWQGSMAFEYDYRLHAAPSFAGSDLVTDWVLDFGTLLRGDSGLLAFAIFNLIGDRVGLDLDAILGTGDTASFQLTLGAFSGQLAGDGSDWLALFDANTVGRFDATYRLDFSDADVGAASSRTGSSLTLRLLGEVIEAPQVSASTVPEPSVAWLLGAALGALAMARSTRRTPSPAVGPDRR